MKTTFSTYALLLLLSASALPMCIVNANRGGGGHHHGWRHARHRAAPHDRPHRPSVNSKPGHHPENAASGIIEESSFERLLKRGYRHHYKHDPWDDLDPAEFCNAVLCKEEAKSCAEELGCHDTANACKEACPEGDRSCCQTCKATFETCAADCLAADDVCLEEGHPDVDTCASCFDEANILSNSTICVKVMEYKSQGKRGSSDSMDDSSNSMSMDPSSDFAASSSSNEESAGSSFPVTGEVIVITCSVVVGLCLGALAYAVKRSMKVQQQEQLQLTEVVDVHEGVPVKQVEP